MFTEIPAPSAGVLVSGAMVVYGYPSWAFFFVIVSLGLWTVVQLYTADSSK